MGVFEQLQEERARRNLTQQKADQLEQAMYKRIALAVAINPGVNVEDEAFLDKIALSVAEKLWKKKRGDKPN